MSNIQREMTMSDMSNTSYRQSAYRQALAYKRAALLNPQNKWRGVKEFAMLMKIYYAELETKGTTGRLKRRICYDLTKCKVWYCKPDELYWAR